MQASSSTRGENVGWNSEIVWTVQRKDDRARRASKVSWLQRNTLSHQKMCSSYLQTIIALMHFSTLLNEINVEQIKMVYLSCELRLDGNSKVSWDCCAKNLSIWRLSWSFRLFRSLSISSAVLGGLEAEVVLGLARVLSVFELWKDEIQFYSRRVGLFMTHWAEKRVGAWIGEPCTVFIFFYTI